MTERETGRNSAESQPDLGQESGRQSHGNSSQETDDLFLSLCNHLESAGNGTLSGKKKQSAQAMVRTLLSVPNSPQDSLTLSVQQRLLADLDHLAADDLNEARICRCWLQPVSSLSRTEIVHLAESCAKLFGPFQFLLYRTLIRAGHRDDMAGLIPPTGPLTIYQADSLLESGRVHELDADWSGRIQNASDGFPAPELTGYWQSLLVVEAEMAVKGYSQKRVDRLAALIPPGTGERAQAFDLAVSRYLSGRWAAAMLRSSIAVREDWAGQIPAEHLQCLPAWERLYLEGLSLLAVSGDERKAQLALRRAREENPFQNSIRLALAALVARTDVEEALTLVMQALPSRETLVTRAGLQFRCCLFRESDATLAELEDPALPAEPARYYWPSARRRIERQARALHAALAEKKGDWQAVRTGSPPGNDPSHADTLSRCRALYCAVRERSELSPRQTWKRGILDEQISRLNYELDRVILNGDSLFYQALANRRSRPEIAVSGCRRLLRQPRWVKAQQRVGSGRLVIIGDLLLDQGEAEDALRAYTLAGQGDRADLEGRLHLVSALRTPPGSATGSPADQEQHGPLSATTPCRGPCHALLPVTILRLLQIGEIRQARLLLDQAPPEKIPDTLLRLLRQLTEKQVASCLAEEEIQQLELPAKTEAVIRLVAGWDTWQQRLQRFIRDRDADDWMADLPLSLEKTLQSLITAMIENGNDRQAFEILFRMDDTATPQVGAMQRLLILRQDLRAAIAGR